MQPARGEKTKKKLPLIGGPETSLPFVVESFLCCSLALSCLGVSGYHYVMSTYISPSVQRLFRMLNRKASPVNLHIELPCWIPLTTCSRDELDRFSPSERLDQLVSLLQSLTKKLQWSDEALTDLLRSSDICRRLASLAMRPVSQERQIRDTSDHHAVLRRQLVRIWAPLLVLPPVGESGKFEISMIVPAFRELGTDVFSKLKRALKACRRPQTVQVVLVDAGACVDLEESVRDLIGCWGELMVVAFTNGGGRGPCLNFGASFATGRFYCFCHSDTALPQDWDSKVVDALSRAHGYYGNESRANSCAFSFGIDTSQAGLNGGPYPPGIKAVEMTANLRSHIYSLPYGDQVLSIPASVFNFVGGFPDQCLMEDYELIHLLRRRSALLKQFGLNNERVVIIKGASALCSPRRWQKFGVLYVTFMNSKFVNMYAGGMNPNDLFTLYYGRHPPDRSNKKSPWEEKLAKALRQEQ